MMRKYVTVHPNSMLLCVTKRIVFVSLVNFTGKSSSSHLNSLDRPFCLMSLVFLSSYCIRYLYWSISHVYGLTISLTRYHGNGSYSICLAMLCVAIVIFGAMLLISFCVTICTTLGATLGGATVFCSVVTFAIGDDDCFWSCIVGYQFFMGALACVGPSGNSCVLIWRPLRLSVIYFFASFVMMLNISIRISNATWCASFNVTNSADGTIFSNTFINSCDASVAASSEYILGIFTLCEGKLTILAMRSDLVSVT